MEVELGLKVPAAQGTHKAPDKDAPVPQNTESPNLRMRLFKKSATMTLPLLSTATPVGRLNEAPVPTPLANAADPLPASVVTTPPGVTLRMRWLL